MYLGGNLVPGPSPRRLRSWARHAIFLLHVGEKDFGTSPKSVYAEGYITRHVRDRNDDFLVSKFAFFA